MFDIDFDSPWQIILVLIIAICLYILLNLFGVWLWNTILVSMFGFPVITFWKFLGLRWLLDILLPGRSSSKVNKKKEKE